MLSAFDLIAVLLVLTAAFGWINHRIVRLPHTIGLLVMGLGASRATITYCIPDASRRSSVTIKSSCAY